MKKKWQNIKTRNKIKRRSTYEKQRNKSLKDVNCFIPSCSEANVGEWSRNEHMKKKTKNARIKRKRAFSFFISVGNEKKKKQKRSIREKYDK